MGVSTIDAARAHVEQLKAETGVSADTAKSYQYVLNRLAKFSPELPVSRPAFEKFLGNAGKPGGDVQVRRYDVANRFLKSDVVQAMNIPNVCDEMPCPRKPVPPKPERGVRDGIRDLVQRLREMTPPPDDEEQLATVDVIGEHLEERRLNGLTLNSVITYGAALTRLVDAAPYLPATPAQICEAIGDPEDYKSSTRRKHYATINGLFHGKTYAALGLESPMDHIDRPRRKRSRRRVFKDKEIAALLEKANAQEGAFVRLVLDTGVRVGEASSLILDYISDTHLSIIGKGKAREVPVSPQVVAELRALANDDGVVWHERGHRLTAAELDTRFRGLVRRAGITGKQVGAHTLRRTFATRWVNGGGSEKHLQVMLGHSFISTTEDYLSIAPREVTRAQRRHSTAVALGLLGDSVPPVPSSTSALAVEPGMAGLLAKRDIEAGLLLDVALEHLKNTECSEPTNGRPRKSLPWQIARLVMDDVEADFSHTAIVVKYRRVAPFSRAWLSGVIADGRLQQMAQPPRTM